MIQRSHNCFGCDRGWVCFGPRPDIRCPFCDSTMVVFRVVP